MTLVSPADRQGPGGPGADQKSTGALVPTQRAGEAEPDRALDGVDVAVAGAPPGYGAASSVVGGIVRRIRPFGGLLGHPPLVPERLAPATLIAELLAEPRTRGRADLDSGRRGGGHLVRVPAPGLVRAVLDSIDLTELVLERLDLDRLAAAVDLDAVAARVGIDAVLDRIDLDAVVARVDLDAAVARVDLDAILGRLDVNTVADRVDLDRAALRLDIAPILARVDIDGVAARLDPQKVLDRIDLIVIAREVLDALDLPEIIRQSTGFLASDAVHGIRARSVSADDAIGSAFARLMPRRRRSAESRPEQLPEDGAR